MSYEAEYAADYVVAEAPSAVRAEFIRKTYGHLGGAILAFMGLEVVLLNIPGLDQFMMSFFGIRYSWLLVLGGFMVVAWLADSWAHSATSRTAQYVGLGLYVVAEALIFVPMLWVADRFFAGEQIIAKAAFMTLGIFIGLTLLTFVSGKDFSFLRSILALASIIALMTIVAGILFGFSLGLWFSLAMVAFASGCILYQTSQVIYHYHPQQYVAAALGLFASVALLFWYVLRIFMFSRD